ncbi:cytochrome C assembly family protein [Bryobacter aggregatus]|uniref:cytochrome C assembly family protein n=1 Tax=Bryobacter aggregatus TaxID=360054 RepID=UPI0004E1BF67|nr:cytochrome c biogenesis protein CcsA [Bryobacter aggregatus]
MPDLSLFWLRIAAILYAAGLFRTLWPFLRTRQADAPLAPGLAVLGSFAVGTVLHMVSIVERSIRVGHLPVDNFFESVSMFAFLLALLYLFVYWRYSFFSLGILLFPVVSLLTGIASTESPITVWANARVRDAWLIIHVTLILFGIASVCITAGASIFYLIQERKLKQKDLAGVSRLPALRTLDSLINRAMGLGFVFTTLGVMAGAGWAYVESGTRWMSNANVQLGLFTWLFYLSMIFLQTSQGWRGRKTAFMALSLLGFSAVTWAAHIGLRTTLER